MQKRITHKATLITMLIVLTIFSLTYIVMAAGNEPGSTEDPIVTQSYIELRNQQLKYYIDENIKKIQDSITQLSGSGTGQSGSAFEVVNVPAGKKLIAGASTELILRSGQATVIDSPSGGIANVTVGKDLKKGDSITANHLLIVPRNDGRGANATTDIIFLVKGSYNIE